MTFSSSLKKKSKQFVKAHGQHTAVVRSVPIEFHFRTGVPWMEGFPLSVTHSYVHLCYCHYPTLSRHPRLSFLFLTPRRKRYRLIPPERFLNGRLDPDFSSVVRRQTPFLPSRKIHLPKLTNPTDSRPPKIPSPSWCASIPGPIKSGTSSRDRSPKITKITLW